MPVCLVMYLILFVYLRKKDKELKSNRGNHIVYLVIVDQSVEDYESEITISEVTKQCILEVQVS